MIFQAGNLKLHKSVGIFSLPEGPPEDGGTCPGCTEVCARICYARKPTKMGFKGSINYRKRMLHATRDPGFVAMVIREVQDRGFKKVRVHEAGDFYSQSYLNKWIHIALGLPEIPFLAFTRNFGLDYSQVPPNLRIYYSGDSANAHRIPKGPQGWIWERGHPRPIKGAKVCPPVDSKNGHIKYCGDTCTFCWVGKQKHVIFPQH